MTGSDAYIKSVYDRTARTITTLQFKGDISEKEMVFLLDLLETIIFSKQEIGLLKSIEEWQKSSLDDEIDDIIRATVLNIDFSDESSTAKAEDIINELLHYGEK